MPRHRSIAVFRITCTVLLAVGMACVQAAELGEAVVRSHIGQPLIADIELTMLTDPSVPVTVKLANPDVYKGASIAMHPALASLTMSVMRRDGRQFLHLTSIKPIDSQYLHLFVELSEAGKRSVRAETLWLTPDPTPAPPPPKPVAAVIAAGAPLPAPAAAIAPIAPRPLPRPTPLPLAAVPAARCPAPTQVQSCAAIDYTNGLLSAQIVELEEKVKALELAMTARAEPLPQAPLSPMPLAKAAPALSPPTAPPTQAGFPWLLGGAIALLLAALGGGVALLLRRRRSKAAPGAVADSTAWYAPIAARFRRRGTAPALVEAVTPKEA